MRNPFLVSTSNLLINAVPGRTPLGLQFLLSPDDPGVLRIEPWHDLPDWALCYWYCLEIQRRMQVYRGLVESFGCRTLTTSVANLKDEQGLRKLLLFLDQNPNELRSQSDLWDRRMDVINEKKEMKVHNRLADINSDRMVALAQEVEYRVSRCT
jgi:hypothetical protein